MNDDSELTPLQAESYFWPQNWERLRVGCRHKFQQKQSRLCPLGKGSPRNCVFSSILYLEPGACWGHKGEEGMAYERETFQIHCISKQTWLSSSEKTLPRAIHVIFPLILLFCQTRFSIYNAHLAYIILQFTKFIWYSSIIFFNLQCSVGIHHFTIYNAQWLYKFQ